jgi:hypothetical protein
LKKRIETVLERATGQALGDKPSAWWQFWLDFNELFVPPERPFDQHSTRVYYTYFVPTPDLFVLPPVGGAGMVGGKGKGAVAPAGQVGGATHFGMTAGFPFGQLNGYGQLNAFGPYAFRNAGGRPFNMGWVYDPLYPQTYLPQTMALPGMFYLPMNGIGVLAPVTCFGAGTLVATLAGPMAIEEIKVGDRVLAQDPETGELAYKSVLKTTVRPPAAMMTLSVQSPKPRSPRLASEDLIAENLTGSESFVSTKGHPFWVNDKGWQMTKNLEPGNRLHTVTGSVAVQSLDEADSVEAYNLVVDEFHTYFIGNTHVLVHDNSFARPLLNSVPGLPPETEKTLPGSAVSR